MDGLIEIFLFCGVLCYFFNLRPNKMVDVLSTRLQEVYAKWETRTEVTRNAEPMTTRFSLDGLRRAGLQFYRRKIQDREQSRKIRESSLYSIKETEPLTPLTKYKSSFMHYCCSTCTPVSKDTLVKSVLKQQQQRPFGVNAMLVKPGSTLLTRIFNCISHVLTIKRYEYPMVTEMVLKDEKLKDAIKLTAWETAKNEGCSEEKALAKTKVRAKNILLQMESKCNDFIIKIMMWLVYKLFPYFIQSVVVLPSQIEMLKEANDTGLPLVLLPLHRSHLDYVLVGGLMVANNIKHPLVAAGDNLNIPFFGWCLRSVGAFFIKRRIDPVAGRKDLLYRATLQTYIMEILRAGNNMEFFMEGGRTRTGKPCMPKNGILSVILDTYIDGTIEDAFLVPIAINYERLVDGHFANEQLGQPKKVETFTAAIKAVWSTLTGHYGIVKVDFCQPFSLREMVKTFQAQQNKLAIRNPSERPLKYSMSNSSLYGTDVIVEEQRQLVDNIARHVIHDSSKSMPIMSTNVVAFLLLNKFRDGCTLDKLVEAFDSMRQELEFADRNLAFCGENIDIIKHALDILGPGLVTQQRQEITEVVDGDQSYKSNVVIAIRPVSIVPNVIELSYYSNTMLVYYIMDSIVVTALYAELQSQINDPIAIAENNITVFQNTLLERALKLCDILRYEFIFCRPCQDLRDIVIETIQNISYKGIITQKEMVYLEDELWSKRYAKNFDDSSDEEYSREREIQKIEYKLSLRPEHSSHMEFLHTILRPLIDTYTCSAFSLRKLIDQSLSESELIQEILSEIKTKVDGGVVNGESLCIDPIKNSFRLFEKWNILECNMHEKVKIFYLKEDCDIDVATKNVYDTIAVFKWTRNMD